MPNVAVLTSNEVTLDLDSATLRTFDLSDLKDWVISVDVAYVTVIPLVNDYSTARLVGSAENYCNLLSNPSMSC
jgi:hypothetical protein